MQAATDLERQLEQALQVDGLGTVVDYAGTDRHTAVDFCGRRENSPVDLQVGHQAHIEPVEVGVVVNPFGSVPETADR